MAEIRKVVLGDVDVGALQMEVESLREQLEAKAERLTTTQELYLAEQARAEAAEVKLAEVEKLEVGFYQERGRAEHAEAKLAEVEKERDELRRGLHKIADFTEQSGGWTKFPNPGGVAGAVHSIARRLLSGDE